MEMMSSVCISKCVNDARVPVRATYVNLYKWPESDAEFVRAMSSRSRSSSQPQQPRVVDSLSCRQMYLRSYKFSTEQDCDTLSSDNDNVSHNNNKYCLYLFKRNNKKKKKNKCLFLKKLNNLSLAIFRRCLSCTTTVDVVDHQHH